MKWLANLWRMEKRWSRKWSISSLYDAFTRIFTSSWIRVLEYLSVLDICFLNLLFYIPYLPVKGYIHLDVWRQVVYECILWLRWMLEIWYELFQKLRMLILKLLGACIDIRYWYEVSDSVNPKMQGSWIFHHIFSLSKYFF